MRRISVRVGSVTMAALLGLAAVAGLATAPDAGAKDKTAKVTAPDPTVSPEQVRERLRKYAPADIGKPSWEIDAKMKGVLDKLVAAAQSVDQAFWDQVSPDGRKVAASLDALKDKASKDLAALMRIHYGPWDRSRDHEPFLGRTTKPEGAGFYPVDLARREVEQWIAEHPADAEAFRSPYTVIRREGDRLVAVPYSKAFADSLGAAAKALREAADKTDCAALSLFLKARADSLLDDEYRVSDRLWMDTASCPVDVVLGPYETYEDRLMDWKTAFEAIVMVPDEIETTKAALLAKVGPELLKNLPLEGAGGTGRFEEIQMSPIVVADEIFAAGQARAGFQVRAFVLPNDEVVRKEKGTKHVILQNVVRARFVHLVKPLAETVIEPAQAGLVDYDAYFRMMLMWQLAHGMAPKAVEKDGKAVAPRVLLKHRYGVIEAARAEAVSLLNCRYLEEHAIFPARSLQSIPVTYLASLLESLRFGTTDTIGQSKLILLNYLLEAGAFRHDPVTRTYQVAHAKFPAAIRALAAELLAIELKGDYEGAGRLLAEYGTVPADLRARLADLSDLPLDILPRYTYVSGMR